MTENDNAERRQRYVDEVVDALELNVCRHHDRTVADEIAGRFMALADEEMADNADEVTRLRAEVERQAVLLRAINDCHLDPARAILQADKLAGAAILRAHAAEAALTRVRETCAAALANPTGWGGPMVVSFAHTALRILNEHRAALDSASPATPPSPAPADDEGTGTGAAPSEGHSEAQRAPIHEGMPCPLVNPPRPGARTWPCCAHCPKGCAAEGWHLVDCGEGCALEPNRWQ